MAIIYVAILWCLGIGAALITGSAPVLWIGGMVVSILLVLLLRNRHDLLLAAVCLLGFCAGGTRASLSITHINVDQFSLYGNDPEVTLIGTVIDEPQVRDRSVAITLQAESLYSAGAANKAVQGRV